MLPKMFFTLVFTVPYMYYIYNAYEKAVASNTVYPFLFFFSPLIIFGIVVWCVAMHHIWTFKR